VGPFSLKFKAVKVLLFDFISLHKQQPLKKIFLSIFLFAFLGISSVLAKHYDAYYTIGDTILPPVFLIGEYENQYNELIDDYETLLFTVCDFDMDVAFSKWQSMLKEMSSFAATNDVDLDGVKIWLNVFLQKNGEISHLAYYLKPMSKNIDDLELRAFFKEFIKSYRFPLLAKSNYSHYGTASFPVHPIRNSTSGPSNDNGQLSTGQN